jgi:protein SEY1
MSLHLVDDDGRLQPEKKLAEYLTSLVRPAASQDSAKPSKNDGDDGSTLTAVGLNYHVVGVFGGQSSGKSTLLNCLFGTDFQMLDERVRRGQTTRGAFMAQANTALPGFETPGRASPPDDLVTPSPDRSSRLNRAAAAATKESSAAVGGEQPVKSPLLVLDFEGTDGLERGEDQSFDRQLSLFGLSVADTLIINMWAVDVGRFNGANLSLLRTIFEVNLQLFNHDNYEVEEKPTLLVVLRDFTEDDPAPSLATVRKSFDTIWENVTRPQQFQNATIDSLFHLKYYVMPHFKLQKEAFAESVGTLRRWFGDSHCANYLFRHPAMFRGVPLEGLPAYLTSCWESIRTSKDLDIPTQREMLAQHRCKEVKDQELKTFRGFTRHYEDRLQRGEMLLRLSEVLDDEMEVRLTSYYRQTKLYQGDVMAQYAAELETDLVDATMQVVNKLSKAIAAEVLANAESRVLGCVEESYRQLVKSAQSLPFLMDDKTVNEEAEAGVADGLSPSEVAERWAGSQVMDSAGCQRLARNFWKTLSVQLNAVVSEVATMPPPAHLYNRYAALIAQDPTARLNVLNVVTDALFRKVKSRVSSMADSVFDTMHAGFERSLTHNSDGTVRFFSTTKGLQKAVPAALQSGMVVLGALVYFRLKLKGLKNDDEEIDGDEQGDAAAPKTQSRSARRVKVDCRQIVFLENEAESAFYLSYSTLDAAPKYPYNVPVASADAGEGPDAVEGNCVLLTQQATIRAYEMYKQKCDFTTQLQLRAVEAGNQSLPAWVFPVMLALGWNELMYVITSPVLLITLIVICVVFFKHFFVAQWHKFEETGPASIVMPLQAFFHTVKHVVGPFVDSGSGAKPLQAEREPATEMRNVPVGAVTHGDGSTTTYVPTAPPTLRHRGGRKED